MGWYVEVGLLGVIGFEMRSRGWGSHDGGQCLDFYLFVYFKNPAFNVYEVKFLQLAG